MTRCLLLFALATGCNAPASSAADPPKFAEDRTSSGTTVKTPFDAERSINYLKEICDIGPRVSGSEGMKKQQDVLVKHFEKHGATVTKQTFEAKQKSQPKTVTMTNLIAKWHPERSKRIILSAHYDTRPIADQEPERGSWNKPFISANDGTSGVAFLMEMAHHLKDLPTTYGIDIVLFDGEEYIFDPGRFFGDGDDYFFGSEHFARDYEKARRKLPWNYDAAVNFDLFAAKDARLAVEGYSAAVSPGLVDEIWKTAAAVKSRHFKYERGFRRAVEVMDDHVALQRAGIPAVDIIDFDYPDWHKLSDTADKVSADTMKDVGAVILTWLQQKK